MAERIFVQETWVNRGTYDKDGHLDESRQHRIGESDVYESWAGTDQIRRLFRSLMGEYGRCTGRVYIGEGTPVGWVFEQRAAYEDDSRKYYKRETWVTLHSAPPTKTVEFHYLPAA